MITLCPKCKLSLAVTAEDLRVAQGQVRCGRCTAVFNALASLQELPEDAPAPAMMATSGRQTAPAGVTEPKVADAESARSPWLRKPPTADSEWDDFRLSPALLEAVRDNGRQDSPEDPPSPEAAEEFQETLQAARGSGGIPWLKSASLGLLLLLVMQIIYRHQASLAGLPLLGPALAGIQGMLVPDGQPDWDIAAYELQQRGAMAEPDAAGTLTVRASIRNGGRRTQPAPMLRLTLLDRFGNRVASRDLLPTEYAAASQAAGEAALLQPGQRLDAEVSLLDPGGGTVGFELDACLRRPDGSTACAAELAPATASAT